MDHPPFGDSLASGEVHVWHAGHDVDQATLAILAKSLSADEYNRAMRFKVQHAYKQFVISRAILRELLGKYLGMEPVEVRFRTTANGKPELVENKDLHFNLSHTDGQTGIAITRLGSVGIDVERVRHNLDPIALAERFFSPKECDWLRSQPISDRFSAFFFCWTAKEAYIKACGVGLSMPLSSFGVFPAAKDSELEFEIYGKPEESKLWEIRRLDFGAEFKAAVAVQAADFNLQLFSWPSGRS